MTPSAKAQIKFLQDLQRILQEGSFTATYKYALLLALADLAVERGDDSGDVLFIPLDAIAEKFILSHRRPERCGVPRTFAYEDLAEVPAVGRAALSRCARRATAAAATGLLLVHRVVVRLAEHLAGVRCDEPRLRGVPADGVAIVLFPETLLNTEGVNRAGPA